MRAVPLRNNSEADRGQSFGKGTGLSLKTLNNRLTCKASAFCYVGYSLDKLSEIIAFQLVADHIVYFRINILKSAAALSTPCAYKILLVTAVKIIFSLNAFNHIKHCYAFRRPRQLISSLHSLIAFHKLCRNQLAKYLQGESQADSRFFGYIFCVNAPALRRQTPDYAYSII